MKSKLAIVLIWTIGTASAIAQTDDSAPGAARSPTYEEQQAGSIEAERQRLGNARIQQDMELRALEEERRLEEAQQESLRAQEEAAASTEANAPNLKSKPSGERGSSDMSQMLEQLRTLGELKDSGYITDKEFKELKQEILDNRP